MYLTLFGTNLNSKRIFPIAGHRFQKIRVIFVHGVGYFPPMDLGVMNVARNLIRRILFHVGFILSAILLYGLRRLAGIRKIDSIGGYFEIV